MSPEIKNTKIGSSLLAAGFALALGSTAYSQTYSFTVTDPTPQNNRAGKITEISSVYNKDAQTLSFSTNLFQKNGEIADGFWVVLNAGPNPKGVQDELAIFYLDASDSFDSAGNATGNGPIVSVYGYNGRNSSSSFDDPGVLLKSTRSGLSAGESTSATGDSTSRSLGFTLSVANVNDPSFAQAAYSSEGEPFNPSNWYGSGYGDGTPENRAGIWLHTMTDSEFAYNSENEIKKLKFDKEGYFDSNAIPTEVVPEPSSTLLIGLAGTLFLFRRKRA